MPSLRFCNTAVNWIKTAARNAGPERGGSVDGEGLHQLTQDLAAKEQQITRMFQEQRLQDEQALAQMNHRLKVSHEAAAISHEINQPLSILHLTAQRLKHQLHERVKADDPAQLLEALQILDDQASRIARTTNQMKAIIRNAYTSLSRIDLVKNAVDALSHQPPNTVAPEIVIRLERREQHWTIVFDDNGPGLPDDHTGDMPLYSSKPSGSGL